ncbi:hypothetical protein GUJ93_ZPchr0010g7984 [Zizania palustris]|uniref:Uncharacterized protein n=1 Tax=Zizania palustris TaxID=103762 RepID=A0A8J5TII3_ZIZPA|nr:hypothetical protein GUJ93_ZPchr0010g7984 [Zizania palustris]
MRGKWKGEREMERGGGSGMEEEGRQVSGKERKVREGKIGKRGRRKERKRMEREKKERERGVCCGGCMHMGKEGCIRREKERKEREMEREKKEREKGKRKKIK